MKILAIDTSTSVLGVALMNKESVLAETVTNLKKNHSLRLAPLIDRLYTEVGWDPSEIELVATAKGPGSYTGVRIGVTTVKTYAWALGIPLVGVSTIKAMAYPHLNFKGVISPIIDARRGQVYTGLYKSINGKMCNIKEDCIIQFSEWLNMLANTKEQVIIVGDDIIKHNESLRKYDKLFTLSSAVNNIPRPSTIGFLANEMHEEGISENVYSFAPSYLQLAEAEAKLLNKCIKG